VWGGGGVGGGGGGRAGGVGGGGGNCDLVAGGKGRISNQKGEKNEPGQHWGQDWAGVGKSKKWGKWAGKGKENRLGGKRVIIQPTGGGERGCATGTKKEENATCGRGRAKVEKNGLQRKARSEKSKQSKRGGIKKKQ